MGQAGITTGGNVGSFISVKSTSFIIDAPLIGREGKPRLRAAIAFPLQTR